MAGVAIVVAGGVEREKMEAGSRKVTGAKKVTRARCAARVVAEAGRVR